MYGIFHRFEAGFPAGVQAKQREISGITMQIRALICHNIVSENHPDLYPYYP